MVRETSEGGMPEPFLLRRGRGTDGGFVVDRKAAKYKHKAGPAHRLERSEEVIRRGYAPVIISATAFHDVRA